MLIKGYTDFGTEVEYLYNPKSGEAGTWDLGHMAGRHHLTMLAGRPGGFGIQTAAIAGPSFRVRGQGSAEIRLIVI